MEPKTVTHLDRPIVAIQGKISGIPHGTTIVTMDGVMPVEYVSEGDRVITRDGGIQRVQWIKSSYVTCNAVGLHPDALGGSRPETKLTLPAGQHLLIRDWRAMALYGKPVVGVRVSRLVDGEYIRNFGARSMRIVQLGFQNRQTVYAGGLEMFSHIPADVPAPATVS